ncbi:MAG: nucleotidyltransferase domain-containing protein [bacterium]
MAGKILSNKQINNLVRRLAQKAEEDKMRIGRAFIFGSYAKNKMNKNSDLDLCFVSNGFDKPIEVEAYLRTELYFLNPNIGIPIDIVAYHPRDFQKTVPLVYEIQASGREVKLN